MYIRDSQDLKRPIPIQESIKWREDYFTRLKNDIKPVKPSVMEPKGLSPGNEKTGISGTLYKTVFVWNLPPIVTCPGASQWCLNHCYNADTDRNIYPIEEWEENWWWFLNRPKELHDKIVQQISQAQKPCAIRLHSSGDYFSKEYIQFWIDIIKEAKDTVFWSYTRSWACKELVPYINKLCTLERIQLFASWDETMSKPPRDWRQSLVIHEDTKYTYQESTENLLCPEQFEGNVNCASCGFCMKPLKSNVIFFLH